MAADDWFFAANQQWTGPTAYRANRTTGAATVARQNARLRRVPSLTLRGGSPPLSHTCSPTGFAAPALPRGGADACSAVRGRSVVVVGDSYARQFYAGLALLLSGGFRAGALNATKTCSAPRGNRLTAARILSITKQRWIDCCSWSNKVVMDQFLLLEQ